MKMKTPKCIFFVGKFKKIWDEECIAQSLETLGLKVIRHEEGDTVESILDHIKQTQPDLVLFAKLQVIGDGNVLIDTLREWKIPTASWTFDLFFDYVREGKVAHLPFFRADYVFTTDGGHQGRFEKMGINHFCLRQGIFEPEAFILEGEKTRDIVFVGSDNRYHPYRTRLMNFLKETYGERFEWIGRDNSDAVRSLDLNKLFSETKVVIGDSVYSPHYWSNRIYESLGRGAFLISPDVPGLEEEFEYYKHFIPYTLGDFEGLRKKIDYYLANDSERESIRRAGFEFTKQNYTYTKRCERLLQVVTGIKES